MKDAIPVFELYGLWQRSIWHEWWFIIIFVLIILIVFMAMGYGIWYLIQHKKYRVKEFSEFSIEQIEHLMIEHYVRAQEQDQFYARLTNVLKQYLNYRYHIPISSTDYEILIKLHDMRHDMPQLHESLEHIFSGATFVKFAQQHVGAERMMQDKESAITIIKKTRPINKAKSHLTCLVN